MDGKYGLLSTQVKTKSIEQILAPLTSQVLLLIIYNESRKPAESETGQKYGGEISKCADTIISGIKKFLEIGQKQIKDSSDSIFITQITTECENLDLASSNLSVSCQRFKADLSNIESADHVTQSARLVLQAVLKLLLVSDNSTIRKLTGIVHSVEDKLQVINKVQDKLDFQDAFKSYSNTVMLLVTMLKSRLIELINVTDREWLTTAISHLQHSIPSLEISVQAYLRYPDNTQAESGKSRVIKQVLTSLSDIQCFLDDKPYSKPTRLVHEAGYFVSRISKVLDMLSENHRQKPLSDLEVNLCVIIGHSMSVARFCLNSNRNLIIRCSQRILQAKDRLLHLQDLIAANPVIVDIRYDYSEMCEVTMDEVCEIEKHVNISVLHLIIDVFKVTTQPVDKLLKSFELVPQKKEDIVLSLHKFTEHSNRICQMAALASASSTNAARVTEITSTLRHLDQLHPKILGVVSAIIQESRNKTALGNLEVLVNRWKSELNSLLSMLDMMLDPYVFLETSEEKILDAIKYCKSGIKCKDCQLYEMTLDNILKYSRRMVDVSTKIVDNSLDPIFRNGFMVFINSLKTARSDVNKAGNNLLLNFKRPNTKDTFLRRLSILEDCVCNMKKGLSSENHLPLTHPDRIKFRIPKSVKKKSRKSNLKPNVDHILPPTDSLLETFPVSQQDKPSQTISEGISQFKYETPELKSLYNDNVTHSHPIHQPTVKSLCNDNISISDAASRHQPTELFQDNISVSAASLRRQPTQLKSLSNDNMVISDAPSMHRPTFKHYHTSLTDPVLSNKQPEAQIVLNGMQNLSQESQWNPPLDMSFGFHIPTEPTRAPQDSKSFMFVNPEDPRSLETQSGPVTDGNTDNNKSSTGLSDIKKLSKMYVSSAVNGDRKLLDNMTADILRLTNHIVECSSSLLKHCPDLNNQSQMKYLSRNVDELAPKMVEEARYVIAGDEVALTSLYELSSQWSISYDKLRSCIDLAVADWSIFTDALKQIILDRNTKELSKQLQELKRQEKNVGDLLSETINLPFLSSSSEDMIEYMEEQKDYIVTLTSRIATASQQVIQTDNNDQEDSILDESCRDWRVCMKCIITELCTLTSGIVDIGSDILPSLRDITLLSSVQMKTKLQHETDMIKDLLSMISFGDSVLKDQCDDALYEIYRLPEEFNDNNLSPKQLNIYQRLTLHIQVSDWILKALPCIHIINQSTSEFICLVDDLLNTVYYESADDTGEKIQEFKTIMTSIQQKIFQGIILSPDLRERGILRKCLDDVSTIYPEIIDNVNKYIKAKDINLSGLVWPLKHRLAARLKRILATLGKMTQIKSSLLPDLRRILNLDFIDEQSVDKPKAKSVKFLKSPTVKSPKSAPKSNHDLSDTSSKLMYAHDSKSIKKTNMKDNHLPSSHLPSSHPSSHLPSNHPKDNSKFNNTSMSSSVLKPLLQDSNNRTQSKPIKRLENYRPIGISKHVLSDPHNESFIQKKTTLNLKGNMQHIERQIERWNENNNPVVMVTSQLTQHVNSMYKYCIGEGTIKSSKGMMKTADQVVACVTKLKDFAATVCNLAVNSSHAEDLMLITEQITSASHQLKIISKVFISTAKNHQAERIITRNASDLMQGIKEMFTLTEIMCLKGLSVTGEKTSEEMDALALLKSWQKRLLEQRQSEVQTSKLDKLGLRRIEEFKTPSLKHLLDKEESLLDC